MREIKFRGTSLKGIWIYGDLHHRLEEGAEVTEIYDDVSGIGDAVIPQTVGQFTGLTDKNGKEIYEGDIVKYVTNDYVFNSFPPKERLVEKTAAISFMAGQFTMNDLDGENLEQRMFMFYPEWHSDDTDGLFRILEVIGNIHDNPELLEKEDISAHISTSKKMQIF